MFVFERCGHYNIVELIYERIQGVTKIINGYIVEGFHSQLVDIFSNVIFYKKSSLDPIGKKEIVRDRYGDCYYAYLHPVTEVDKSLLKYVDNMVPKIELQRLFYKLNNVELINDVKTLKKDK